MKMQSLARAREPCQGRSMVPSSPSTASGLPPPLGQSFRETDRSPLCLASGPVRPSGDFPQSFSGPLSKSLAINESVGQYGALIPPAAEASGSQPLPVWTPISPTGRHVGWMRAGRLSSLPVTWLRPQEPAGSFSLHSPAPGPLHLLPLCLVPSCQRSAEPASSHPLCLSVNVASSEGPSLRPCPHFCLGQPPAPLQGGGGGAHAVVFDSL